MGGPAPRPAPAPVYQAPIKVAAPAETMAQSTEERKDRANKKSKGRSSLIVNRGGAQGLGGGDDNASIKKKTLG
jgi:hypothetical protein